MAFLTAADVQEFLPSTTDQKVVDNILVRIEADLKKGGLVFDAPSPSVQYLLADCEGQRIFNFQPATSITQIDITDRDQTSVVSNLSQYTDYDLIEHPSDTSYYYQLNLYRYQLRTPYYLKLSATFGFYINFSDENAFNSRLLKAIIVNFIKKQLEYESAGYREITSSDTGDSTVSFATVENRKYFSSITQDPEFSEDLSYFFV